MIAKSDAQDAPLPEEVEGFDDATPPPGEEAPVEQGDAPQEVYTAEDHPFRRANDPMISRMAQRAAGLGYEVVDFAGFIEDLDARSVSQIEVLSRVRDNADDVANANTAIADLAEAMQAASHSTMQTIEDSAERVHAASRQSNDVVSHIGGIAGQMEEVLTALVQVQESNANISEIAVTVKMLAINARIEATRAGEAGAGFANIAQAISDLAVITSDTAKSIQEGVTDLSDTMRRLSEESDTVRATTDQVIADNQETDAALTRIADAMTQLQVQSDGILEETLKARGATDCFAPAVAEIEASIGDTSSRITGIRERATELIDHTESIVQDSVSLGGQTDDHAIIDRVISDAQKLSHLMEEAVDKGRIGIDALFARKYDPIPGSNPEQVRAPFTKLTDQLFPPVQEAALEFSDKVVFCAAVNVDGYLPTHNRKFSHPQGDDPDWNMAHCRHRRIFDDRVGLKAGRNTKPFLLQVYRRDMGGGQFKLMKDVSAPIMVHGKHWGGLRLAYIA